MDQIAIDQAGGTGAGSRSNGMLYDIAQARPGGAAYSDPESTAARRVAVAAGEALMRTLELHDPRTGRHHRQVGHLAALIARGLARPETEIEGIRLAASLHDLGKIGVPRSIIDAPGRLRLPELQLLQTHAETGYDLLSGIAFPWPVAEMVLQHHERLDGSGYPDGLAGNAILLGARIIAVADVLGAMTTDRAYRRAPGLAAGLAELRSGSGVLYDASVVEVCIALCERDPAAVFPETGAVALPADMIRGQGGAAEPRIQLTTQQQAVMRLAMEGMSTKQIARELRLGVGTVKVHLSRAYVALDVHNRTAAARAMERWLRDEVR